jgi:G:T-mismatch repair DNA endonuclease (very short patch repair protein)
LRSGSASTTPSFFIQGTVVEIFGDFWHSRLFTGKAPFDHECELVAAYAEIGISCLVLWESEFKMDIRLARARVVEHLVRD